MSHSLYWTANVLKSNVASKGLKWEKKHFLGFFSSNINLFGPSFEVSAFTQFSNKLLNVDKIAGRKHTIPSPPSM